jgi:hypothetical protein
MRSVQIGLLVVLLLAGMLPVSTIRAEPIASPSFQTTWARTDQPVASGAVQRTWMWGPDAFSGSKQEDYAESPGGQRTVQYFDKSRMEITHPDGDQSSPWYVTNGLLVVEMMTGQMQVGDSQFVARQPADIPVAGDADDQYGPTYLTMAQVRDQPALGDGESVIDHLDRAGGIRHEINNVGYNVHAAFHVQVPGIDHQVAEPFWAFMNATGLVFEDGQTHDAPLFQDPFYATGYPVTEAYWADYKVGGSEREVLVQCFERRCLTYTPDNAPEWQVEAGNVGQHYYHWRYPEAPAGPSEQANTLAQSVRSAESDTARVDAIMQVLGALNIGVYTGQGQQILGGAERSAGDFYLYDIEVSALSGAFGRGQSMGVIDLALALDNMGFYTEDAPLDPEVLRQAILTVTAQAAQQPDAPGSLIPLLARQLGLSQPTPFDLLNPDTPLDAMLFDPLSGFLLLATISIPAVQDALPATLGTSQMIAQSQGILKPTGSNPCDPSNLFGGNGDAEKNAYGFTKNFADLLELIPETIGKVSGILDAIHGAVLAFSVNVAALSSSERTHWGHEGSGQPINVRSKVEMRDQLPQAAIDCGWIAGTDYPDVGPIPGVSVHWFWSTDNAGGLDFDQQGQIQCGNACVQAGPSALAIDATDSQGIATLTLTPNKEPDPGKGTVVEDTGMVTGIALYQSHFGNLLGSYVQYAVPKSDSTRWFIERHVPPGWDITLDGTLQVSMSVTDNNPDAPGTFTEHASDKDHLVLHLHLSSEDLADPNKHLLTITDATSLGSIHYDFTGTYTRNCDVGWDDSWTGVMSFTRVSLPDQPGQQALGVSFNAVRSPNGDKYQEVQDCYPLWDQDEMARAIQPKVDLDKFGIVLTPGQTTIQSNPCDFIPGFRGKQHCDGSISGTVTVAEASDRSP